jgi:hypothetical protein
MIRGSFCCAISWTVSKRPAPKALVAYCRDSTPVQLESVGVAKVLQSEKNTVEILDAMEDETLESHNGDSAR